MTASSSILFHAAAFIWGLIPCWMPNWPTPLRRSLREVEAKRRRKSKEAAWGNLNLPPPPSPTYIIHALVLPLSLFHSLIYATVNYRLCAAKPYKTWPYSLIASEEASSKRRPRGMGNGVRDGLAGTIAVVWVHQPRGIKSCPETLNRRIIQNVSRVCSTLLPRFSRSSRRLFHPPLRIFLPFFASFAP